MEKMDVRRGYVSPRWIHTKVDIPAESEVTIPPSVFRNDTEYRWRLVDLVFAWQFDTVSRTHQTVYTTGMNSIWARQLLLELGKTGQSDQNLVKGTISALCANQYLRRQKSSSRTEGWDCRLPSPYRLPRDAGLSVTYENLGYSLPGDDHDYHRLPPLAFAAFGRDEVTGRAVIFAGDCPEYLNPGDQVTLNSADLFNRGRNEILIDRFVMLTPTHFHNGKTVLRDPTGTWVGWIINPTGGELWMPSGAAIPSACLAPLAHPLGEDEGPRAYLFPKLSYLYPRQRLGVKFTNESGDAYTLHVCLLAEMEVE